MREVDGFREVVNFISLFNLPVHGEHHLQAVVHHGAVEVIAFVGRAGVAVVNRVGQAGVQVVFDAHRRHAGGYDDGEDRRLQGVSDHAFVHRVQRFLAVFQNAGGYVLRVGHAGFLHPGEGEAASGERHFVLFRQRVAQAGPEIFARRMGDDFRIDEGVVGVAFSVNGALEAVVRVVHDAHCRHGCAVRCESRKCEEWLLQKVGRPLGRVHRAPAADSENHVGFFYFRDFRQGLCVFKRGIVAILEAAQDFDLPFANLANEWLRRCARLHAADDHRRLAIV